MAVADELVELQCAWLDTSLARSKKSKYMLIEPLTVVLNGLIGVAGMPRDEAVLSLCGKLVKVWQQYDPPVASCEEQEVGDKIKMYVERVYRLFEEEWQSSFAYLTHKRKSLEDTCYYLLNVQSSRPGRPKELQGKYTTISVGIRTDLLAWLDSQPKSRRSLIESLLEQAKGMEEDA